MADELRAFPDLLSLLGNELADHGQGLLVLQQSCHDAAEGAQPGWIGASAEALTGLLDRWTTASADHLGRIGEHARGMRFAAAGLTELERSNAAAVSRPAR